MKQQTMEPSESVTMQQQVKKSDCLSVDDAVAALSTSRATLYSYMNIVNAQRYRFRADRKTYITKSDVERIRGMMSGDDQ
jgi:hypothetical protein